MGAALRVIGRGRKKSLMNRIARNIYRAVKGKSERSLIGGGKCVEGRGQVKFRKRSTDLSSLKEKHTS